MNRLYFILLFLFNLGNAIGQSQTFKENQKWGIAKNDSVIIPAIYDTVFNFDQSGKVCLACFKSKTTNNSKIIKVTTTVFHCNYLSPLSKRLILKTRIKDTCSVFVLEKNTFANYTTNDTLFKVKAKNHMYLVSKNFKQLSYKPYVDIDLCDEPGFYVAQDLNEVDVPMHGLINSKEDIIIPFKYSGVKVNPDDSLVMVCGTGYGAGAEDYVFDYSGKKINSNRHHIDLATKNYIVLKLFDPIEKFIIYCNESKEETELLADETKYYSGDKILIRIKTEWYIYDLKTKNQKLFTP